MTRRARRRGRRDWPLIVAWSLILGGCALFWLLATLGVLQVVAG